MEKQVLHAFCVVMKFGFNSLDFKLSNNRKWTAGNSKLTHEVSLHDIKAVFIS
jgi:hypothetical protein